METKYSNLFYAVLAAIFIWLVHSKPWEVLYAAKFLGFPNENNLKKESVWDLIKEMMKIRVMHFAAVLNVIISATFLVKVSGLMHYVHLVGLVVNLVLIVLFYISNFSKTFAEKYPRVYKYSWITVLWTEILYMLVVVYLGILA